MITVKICRGTVCHVMGGSDLPLIPDYISEELKLHLHFEGTTCLGYCNNEDGTRPPYVEVNGIAVSDANYSKIIDCIKTEIKAK